MAFRKELGAANESRIQLSDYDPSHGMGAIEFSDDDALVAGVNKTKLAIDVWTVGSGRQVARRSYKSVIAS
jgi:hypothetical protein